jgi:signal recognition particle receptor subunit beta
MGEIDDFTTAESMRGEITSSPAALPSIEEESKPMRRKLWQTTVRESLLPLLPPPVIRGIHSIDAALSVHVGPEPTITLTVTILVAWIMVALLQRILSRSSGRAIKTVDEDPLLSKGREERFDATVLLIGPRNAGKTRLFYHICYLEPNMPTVASLKPNVGVASSPSDDSEAALRIRIMDWPGHAPIAETLAALNSGSTNTLRVVLVVDATQPVAAAAELLYQLLQYAHEQTVASRPKNTTLPVLVACHKKDLPKAKNDKRIKIQLRTELERLLSHANPAWWSPHQPVDLDEVPRLQLFLTTTSCQDAALSSDVMEFCRTGTVSS